MPFDMDVVDADWRSELSEEQLDVLERRQPPPLKSPVPAPKVPKRARLGSRGSRVD